MAQKKLTDAEYLAKKAKDKIPMNRAERRAWAKVQRKAAVKANGR